MFRKVVGLVAAVAAIAAAAVVVVVALAFALYAAVRELIGPAWGAAAVAGAAAILALILAWLLTRKARPKRVKGDTENVSSKLLELARERPLVAIAAVGAAAAVVIRNPRVLTAIITATFANRPPPERKK